MILKLIHINVVLVLFGLSGQCQADTSIYSIVDTPPMFPGGDEVLSEYFTTNIHYPTTANLLNVEGFVYVNVIIEPNGEPRFPKIVRGLGNGCDKEALRLVKNLPYFKPGSHQGELKRVSYTIPVKFELPDRVRYPNGELVNQFASFPGGDDDMWHFITKHIEIPQNSYHKGDRGKVVITFVVMANGELDRFVVEQGRDSLCVQQVLRVFRMMPKWKPAIQDGIAEDSIQSFGIVFATENYTGDPAKNKLWILNEHHKDEKRKKQ